MGCQSSKPPITASKGTEVLEATTSSAKASTFASSPNAKGTVNVTTKTTASTTQHETSKTGVIQEAAVDSEEQVLHKNSQSTSVPSLFKNKSTILKKNTSMQRNKNDQVYLMLLSSPSRKLWFDIQNILDTDPKAASYTHPTTLRTPLHLACILVDDGTDDDVSPSKSAMVACIQAMIQDAPDKITALDANGCTPLQYLFSRPGFYRARAHVLRRMLAERPSVVKEFMARRDVVWDSEAGGVTPLYYALQIATDDVTLESFRSFLVTIQEVYPDAVNVSNEADGDKPLALLHRRFLRQFDLSEQFFPGDNSRPEVIEHRRRYQTAAGNTWKIMTLLLQQPNSTPEEGTLVHRAIQVEAPPDLLRYWIETNEDDLTTRDKHGNLPLHYAAKSLPHQSSFPYFYSKYVIDELLYKFPQAAAMLDDSGKYPVTLALESGKFWIGGGVKSLYDAYPQALGSMKLEDNESLSQSLSFGEDQRSHDKSDTSIISVKGIRKDEHHDAIMLIQEENVAVSEIVSAMWAYEEDAGLQMLSCVALLRRLESINLDSERTRIAMSTLAPLVNAMKTHPNEPVIQEKASQVLRQLACADGHREISFVASGAIAAVVGAMQIHLADPNVQEETCATVAAMVRYGGSERATVVASVSGVTAILNALTAHPHNSRVQMEGCRALQSLTDFPNANVPQLPKMQVEVLLKNAKRRYPECTEIANLVLSRLS